MLNESIVDENSGFQLRTLALVGVAHYLSERVTSLVLKTIDNRS